MKRHHKIAHGKALEPVVNCPECGEGIGSRDGLSTHLKNEHNGQSFPCPTCDEKFTSEHAVTVHHSKAHNERLNKVGGEVCPYCDRSDFESKHALITHAGKAHDEHIVADEYECTYCGDKVIKYPFEIPDGQENVYCNYDCYGAHRANEYVGENHPQWKGGTISYYGENWERQKRKARERDNYTCQSCKKTEDENGRAISVHHIQPLRRFRSKYEAPEWWKRGNKLENLVCLCDDCHPVWEGLYLRPDTR